MAEDRQEQGRERKTADKDKKRYSREETLTSQRVYA